MEVRQPDIGRVANPRLKKPEVRRPPERPPTEKFRRLKSLGWFIVVRADNAWDSAQRRYEEQREKYRRRKERQKQTLPAGKTQTERKLFADLKLPTRK